MASNLSHAEYQAALKQGQYYGSELGIDYVLDKFNLDAIVVPALSYIQAFNTLAGESSPTFLLFRGFSSTC